MRRITIALILAGIFGIGSAAAQCYTPTGWYASEVLLSKPGVTYDLSLLEATGNVTVVRSSILYRSHYDDRVAVILTPLEIFNEKGLDVRIQLPTKFVETTIRYLEMDMNETVKVSDLNMMGGRNIGWVLDLDYRPDPFGGPPIQVANLTKGNLKVTLIPNVNETIADTYIRIEVTNMTTLTEQNKTEISQIFDAIGYPKSFETLTQGLEFNNLPRTTEDLASALDIDTKDFKWTDAMKTELEWLRRNRVISGLTDSDIETLSTLAPYSWGEHNFKSRYYKDGWVLGITEEMLTVEYTLEYRGPPNCEGFDSSVLPDVTVEDFNTSFQPLGIIFEQSVMGAGIRGALIGGSIIVVSILYIRRRRSRRRSKAD